MMGFQEYVDDLFARTVLCVPRRRGTYPTAENPVDDGKFVLGLDAIAPQKRRALLGLEALADFAINGSPHLQPLPLSYAAREARKIDWDENRIVALYARSWAGTGYDPRHPKFKTYACGILALPYVGPIFLKHHPELALAYPPKVLEGLTDSSYVSLPPKQSGRLKQR
jgi:hypothetical protein